MGTSVKPGDRAPRLVTFQPAAGGDLPPGRLPEGHLLVTKDSTRYPTRREALHRAIDLRMTLVELLESAGQCRAAKKLAFCGRRSLPVVLPGQIWRVHLGCGAAYCPVCVIRRRDRVFKAMRDRILQTIQHTGAAVHLVFALPPGQGSVLERLTRVAKEIRSAKQAPAWRGKFKATIGVVMGLEVSGGSHLCGHPHVHLFAYSAEAREVQAFTAWLKARWMRRVDGVLVEGCEELHLSAAPEEWAPRLRYVMKGSKLDPTWPPGLLQEVVAALSAGKRLLTTWGIAMRRGGWTRVRRATNIQVFRPNHLGKLPATG